MPFQEFTSQDTKAAAAAAKLPFEALQFAGTNITLPEACYRVYVSGSQFTEVEASSAHEAMQKTGIRTPCRIERFSLNHLRILTHDILNGGKADIASSAQEALPPLPQEIISSAENPQELTPFNEAVAAERELSADEVDALLKAK